MNYFEADDLRAKLSAKLSWAERSLEVSSNPDGKFILPKRPIRAPPESITPGVRVANQIDTFLKRAAKNFGGTWSPFAKGFLFKVPANAKEFANSLKV